MPDYTYLTDEHPDAGKNSKVRSYLETLSKNQLIDLLMKGQNLLPSLGCKLADDEHLKKGDTDKIVNAIRNDITAISSEPAWVNHWNDESCVPDYSPVANRFETLLASGQADVVIELGAYLMECGLVQVEQSDDGGETAQELGLCMAVV